MEHKNESPETGMQALELTANAGGRRVQTLRPFLVAGSLEAIAHGSPPGFCRLF
jgi:hypothetical protein